MTTRPPVLVFADYTDPLSYLVKHRMDRLSREFDMPIVWQGLELCPEGTPLPDVHATALASLWRTAQELAARDDVPLAIPSRAAHTALAWEASLVAAREGVFTAFQAAVYRAYFVDDRDISDREVLLELAGLCGMDIRALGDHLSKRTLRPLIEAQREEARAMGVDGVPVCFVGKARLVGVHAYGMYQRELVKFLTAALELKPKIR